jgi:hypothetical protein
LKIKTVSGVGLQKNCPWTVLRVIKYIELGRYWLGKVMNHYQDKNEDVANEELYFIFLLFFYVKYLDLVVGKVPRVGIFNH